MTTVSTLSVRILPGGPDRSGVPVVEAAAIDVWSVDPLPRDFPRLGETDLLADGVHLHSVHYRTIRAAVEEEATVAALQRRHRPSATSWRRMGRRAARPPAAAGASGDRRSPSPVHWPEP